MEGTALSERDLQRSRAESASAVFLLADRFSPNYQQEDLNVQFQATTTSVCSIKRSLDSLLDKACCHMPRTTCQDEANQADLAAPNCISVCHTLLYDEPRWSGACVQVSAVKS